MCSAIPQPSEIASDRGAVGTAGRRRSFTWLPFAILLLGQGLLVTAFATFTAEDAFIVFRYAENVAHGHGLVFNVTDPPEHIAMLTSPLHGLLCAAFAAVGLDVVVAGKALGILMGFAATFAVAWRLRRAAPGAQILGAAALCSPYLALWAVGGLETTLLSACVTVLVLAVERFHGDRSAKTATLVSLVAGCALLTRHDAIVFVGPVLVHALLTGRRQAVRLIAPGAAIVLAWFAFSLWYYHTLLPSPYYVKKPSISAVAIAWNARYVWVFLLTSGAAVLVAAAVARRLGTRLFPRDRGVPRIPMDWGVLVGFLCLYGYALAAATTHMMFCHRLLVPYLPVCVLWSLSAWKGSAKSAKWPGRMLLAGFTVAAVAMLATQARVAWLIEHRTLNPGPVGEYTTTSRRDYVQEFARVLAVAAGRIEQDWRERALQPLTEPVRLSGPRVITAAAGILPYHYPEAYVYDALGSYRKHCSLDLEACADYRVLLSPLHGAPQQLVGRPIEQYEQVFAGEFRFEGATQTLYVYYLPHAAPHQLPLYVDQTCLETPPPRATTGS